MADELFEAAKGSVDDRKVDEAYRQCVERIKQLAPGGVLSTRVYMQGSLVSHGMSLLERRAVATRLESEGLEVSHETLRSDRTAFVISWDGGSAVKF